MQKCLGHIRAGPCCSGTSAPAALPPCLHLHPRCHLSGRMSRSMSSQRRGHTAWHRSPAPAPRRQCLVRAQAAASAAPPADLEITAEHMPKSRVRLSVTVPADQCAKAWKQMLKKAHKEFQSTQTDGFKAGQRIPDKLLITFLGGKMGSRAAAVELLVNATMPQAVKQSGFEATAISDSLALEGLTDEMVAAFSVEKPFSYSCGFDTVPKGQWQQPYRSLKVDPQGAHARLQVEVQSAGDEQSCWAAVARDLREKQKEGATLRIATRGLQMGDVCVADVTVTRNDAAENNVVSRQQGVQLDTDTAETSFVPGAVAQMMGMKVGDQREVVVTLPQQWHPPQFAGVEVTLAITIKELFDRELPELNDEWATKTFPACDSLGDLRDKLHRGHLQQAAEKTVNALQLAVTYAIADAFDVQPPDSMVRELAEQEYQAQLLQLQSQGTMDRKNIEKLATEDLLLKFLENKREELTRTVKAVMAAEALLAEEGITIPTEEIEAEVARASKQFNEWGQEFDPAMLREQVVESLQGEKVVDFIQENAEVVFLPPVQQ